MTCIIGMVEKGVVYMGGDSAGVAGYSIQQRTDPKVFKNGPFLMGFTSSFRMGQLLRFCLKPPKHIKGKSDYEFMVVDFVNAVRKTFKDGGYAKLSNNVESGGSFLVGYKGNLYEVDDDYQVGMHDTDISAIGCGEQIALGAMYALNGLPPKERIEKALQITTTLNAGVRAPYVILESK